MITSKFQTIALMAIGIFLLFTLRSLLRGGSRGWSLAWGLVWIAAAAAILMPDLPNAVAEGIGIGRGADLVLYVFALGVLAGFFWLGARDFARERGLTLLVRHIALRDAFDQCELRRVAKNVAPSNPTMSLQVNPNEQS